MIRKDGTGPRPWRVRIEDGQGGKVQRSFRTKREAEDFELEFKTRRSRMKAGLEEMKPDVTFNQLAELWKANTSPSTWRLNMLKHSEQKWGRVRVRSIQSEAIGVWLHGLPLAPKTKTHILETMRQVCNAGVEWGYLHRSPARARAVKAPGGKRLTPIKPFESWEEVVRVATISTQSPLVRFLAATGLRCPSEWRSAVWGDVSFGTLTMLVRGTKTENAERTIPLSRRAVEALAELPHGLPHAPLFPPFDYHQWRKVAWPEALDAAELERRTPYELRHTFATLALQAGAQIEDVSKVMGHANIGITLTYYRKWTRPMENRLRDILDTIDSEDRTLPGHLGPLSL